MTTIHYAAGVWRWQDMTAGVLAVGIPSLVATGWFAYEAIRLAAKHYSRAVWQARRASLPFQS